MERSRELGSSPRPDGLVCGAEGTVRVKVRGGQRPWIQGMTGRRRSLSPGHVDSGQLCGVCSKNEQKSPRGFLRGNGLRDVFFKEKPERLRLLQRFR